MNASPEAGIQETKDATASVAQALRRFIGLVVDDSNSQRKMLSLLLRKWNIDVIEAVDGAEALEICEQQHVDFVISDWMMPRMSGLELCEAIRNSDTERYIYFILVTSKRASDEVAQGLDAGADDFISKPINVSELEARLRAGQRMLLMQEDLFDKNQRISDAFDELNGLYQSIENDLAAAARLQKQLIPPRQAKCGTAPIGVAYKPSGHVGGDLLGYFTISEDRIGIYSIDVSGHGVSSALLTARLSNLFNPQFLAENIAVRQLDDGTFCPRDPARVMEDLNERMQDDSDSDQYFTMILADVNLKTGMVRYCQAGHPSPALIRATGEIEFIGDGGPPVGLMPGMSYETSVVQLSWGDRMMMFSDGIVECENAYGDMLENEGLEVMLLKHWGMSEHETLDNVMLELAKFNGSDQFEDDISAVLLTMP